MARGSCSEPRPGVFLRIRRHSIVDVGLLSVLVVWRSYSYVELLMGSRILIIDRWRREHSIPNPALII